MKIKGVENQKPKPATAISVALVEDNRDFAHTVRDFLSAELDIELLGMSHDETSFQDIIRKNLPEIALIDLGLSRPDSGVDLLRWLAREFPIVRPIIMTVNEREILRCYEFGARGYILKSRLEILAATLRQVHAGQLIIPPDVGEILVRQMAEQGRKARQTELLQNLSDREREIILLHQKGLSRKALADQLSLSFFTVRRHLQNILEKTGLPTIRDLLEKYGEVL